MHNLWLFGQTQIKSACLSYWAWGHSGHHIAVSWDTLDAAHTVCCLLYPLVQQSTLSAGE